MKISEPMTPSDCDLRGLPFMQLDVVRLIDSDLFALSTGDEFKAAVALWCKSWLQVPAASLPDDDRVLAHLSAAGSRWKKVKTLALRGWIKCSDGRLYHPTVAEKALHAWKARTAQRERAAKRWQKKDDDAGNATASEKSDPTQYHGISPGNALERERERESISSLRSDMGGASNAAAPEPKLKQSKAKRGRRIPADWAPSPELQAFARENGVDPDHVAAKFRDYWLGVSGERGIKLDWDATWRNWVRNDSSLGPARRPAPASDRPRTAAQNADENARFLMDRMGVGR